MESAITIETIVNVPIEKAWECWSAPEHITKWAFASDEWHCPSAENDIQVGGKFTTRMEAKDGSFGFDFWGIYDEVQKNKFIAYTMGDGRKATITFTDLGNQTKLIESFDPESENPIEMQRAGWQAILNNFKKHTETV